MQRCVAHLDMDAFYVGVELMRRPELRGRPVVVAGTGPRAVVTTASYEARRYGVFSAIPAARARRLCPEAIFLPPDFEAYRAMSKRVMDRVRAQVDTVEVAGLDEAYLDLSGIYSPRAAMRRLVSEIKADTGLGCSVGIGPNRLVAKVCSDAEKPKGFVMLTREQACKRFAGSRRGCCPGSGQDGRAARGARDRDDRAARSDAARDPGRALRRPPRPLPDRPRALRGRDPVSSERIAVSESRETTFPTDIADRAEQPRPAAARGRALRGAREERSPRAHDRHQGAPRGLHHRHPRPHRRGADQRRHGGGRRRLRAAEEYAPARPLRLLGVRVAAFAEPAAEDGEDAPQLTFSV